jgi:GNAT superfamily N-acetyltransferase
MYKLKDLEGVNFEEIADTWNLAFSDYIVKINMKPEEIEAYFRTTKVERSSSFGAYYDGTLVGMLLNSVDTFRGKTVAYDAMTGVVPEHRDKGVFSLLFEYTKNHLKSNGITHYYLEVITENKKAFEIYRKKGGKIDREFSVMEGRISNDFCSDIQVTVLPLRYFPTRDISEYEPSLGNRIVALHRNIHNYKIACVEVDGRKVAAIFNGHGGVLQIMFHGAKDKNLLRILMSYLSRNFEILRISNIPTTETALIDALLKMGFNILVNQYEMSIDF